MKIFLQDISDGKNYCISPPCVIGRDEEADVTFSDAAISHRHAMISETDNQIWIEDLESVNGVFVNGLKVEGKAIIKSGDSILLGKTSLLVETEEDFSEQTLVLHSLSPGMQWNLDHQRLKLIYDITAELSEKRDIVELGEKLFSRFKEIFNQDRGCIALFREDGSLEPVFSVPASKSVPLSRSITGRLFRNGESFLLEDALSDASLKEQESVIALRIRSALCAPLTFHDQIYGLIYVDRNIPGAYTQDDLALLGTIALILAPLIENARLWSELESHYANALEKLKVSEARLIDMERKAAYVRLAQAMAHEIRNPLAAIGGLIKRMSRLESENLKNEQFQTVVTLVEKVEMVLKEVDTFVRIPSPQKKLEKVDDLIQEEITKHNTELQNKRLQILFSVNTPHLMVPLDSDLFRRALSMIFREILFSIPEGTNLKISIQDIGNELEMSIGETESKGRFCDPFDRELSGKPWSLSLFLNIAYRIISDHGGKLLVDPEAKAAVPMIMRIPRMIKAG